MNNPPVIKREKHPRALAFTPEEQPASELRASRQEPVNSSSKVRRSPSPASQSEIVCTGIENKATKRLKVTQQAAKDAVVIEESLPAEPDITREEEEPAIEDQQLAATLSTREEETIVEDQQTPPSAATQQKEAAIEGEQPPTTPTAGQTEETNASEASSSAKSGECETRCNTPRKAFKTSTRKPKSPVRHRHRIDGRWVTCPHASPREGCGQAYYFG